jgi:hypothetical protein
MSTGTMQGRHHAVEERLGALGRRIDDLRDRVRGDKEEMDRRVERHLDAVRAKDAEIRTELRRRAEEDDAAWDAYFDEVNRELDELDAEVVVAESQVAAGAAADWDDFERAIHEELEAYERVLDATRHRMARATADVHRHAAEAVERARGKVREAGDALRRGRANAARRWKAERDQIRTQMEAVDAAVIDAVASVGTQITEGGSDRER